jgi:hypothetical protein
VSGGLPRATANVAAPHTNPPDRTGARVPSGALARSRPLVKGAANAPVLGGVHSSKVALGASGATAAGGARPVKRASKVASGTSGNPLDSIGRHIPLPLPVPDWSKPIILALLLAALWFGTRSRLAARRARVLERQRVALLRDLEVMQAALVPEIPPEVAGIPVSAAYRAAEGPGAGGDFYDVLALEDGRVAVILGDVVGHGHEALIDAALTRFTIRAYLQAGLDPRATLALANRVLTEPNAERYVTVAVGLFDSRAGELTYATAGHPTPIILGSFEPDAISGCPALSCGLPTGRRQTRISLAQGAQVCFFSDGLLEARLGDGLFGRERLRAILPTLGPSPQAGDLLAAVREQADACHDDMSACVVLPQGTSNGACTYVEEFDADARALAGGQAEHFLQACSVPEEEVVLVLERASATALADGSAMLRVQIGAGTSAVTVGAGGAGPATAVEYRPAGWAPAAMHPSSA